MIRYPFANRLHIPYIILLPALLAMWGCVSRETKDIGGYGWISLKTTVQEVDEAPMTEPLSLTICSADSLYKGTWPNINEFDPYESYYAGEYEALAFSGTLGAEGYGCQCYAAVAPFVVPDGAAVTVKLDCTLQQAMVKAQVEQSADYYEIESVTIHTKGYGFNCIDMEQQSPLLIMPGDTYCHVQLKNADGKTMTVVTTAAIETDGAQLLELNIGANDTYVSVIANNAEQKIDITPAMFDSPMPKITTSGFNSGEKVTLIEGYPSASQLIMQVEAAAGLSHVVLTSQGSYLDQQDIPASCDLMSPPLHLKELGLEIDRIGNKKMNVDFTKFIENLNVDFNDEIEFTVVAVDALGRVSDIATLVVEIRSVDLDVLSVSPAILGENRAIIELGLSVDNVEASDFSAYADIEGPHAVDIEVLEVDRESRRVTFAVTVPDGIEAVPIVVEYMGLPKLRFDVPRSVPKFEMSIDAFANSAVVTVLASTPEQAEVISQYISVYANKNKATITERNIEQHMLEVIGLSPNKQYEFDGVVIPGQYAAVAKIETEDNAPVPMGDFEDFEDDFTYKNMPCGGNYSTAAFPIYSNQNFANFDVKWVKKYWTSVNAKTFCTAASCHNTWYMRPSSNLDFSQYESGLKSMHLTSVGWSLHGEEIPPYMQADGEYVPYNKNVPNIEHRSAGKLFLGSYTFDASTCSEMYTEGVNFGSRPSSLNGFYKYIPDANHDTDKGVIRIQLLGGSPYQEQVIAEATLQLSSAPDFVSFNLPLQYIIMNVKATKLKIMIASSIGAGDIATEDHEVPVSPNVPEACYTGSELWIDNLSFSY